MLNKIYLVFPVIRFFRITGILFWTLFVQSCITEDKCAKRFPGKDSVHVESRIDTVVRYKPIITPGSITIIRDTVKLPSDFTFHKKYSAKGFSAFVNIFGGKVDVSLSVPSANDSSKIVYITKTDIVTDVKVVERITNTLTKIQSFLQVCGWLFWILLLMLIIWLIAYFRK